MGLMLDISLSHNWTVLTVWYMIYPIEFVLFTSLIVFLMTNTWTGLFDHIIFCFDFCKIQNGAQPTVWILSANFGAYIVFLLHLLYSGFLNFSCNARNCLPLFFGKMFWDLWIILQNRIILQNINYVQDVFSLIVIPVGLLTAKIGWIFVLWELVRWLVQASPLIGSWLQKLWDLLPLWGTGRLK